MEIPTRLRKRILQRCNSPKPKSRSPRREAISKSVTTRGPCDAVQKGADALGRGLGLVGYKVEVVERGCGFLSGPFFGPSGSVLMG